MQGDGFTISIAQRTPVRPEDCPPDSKLGRLHADLVATDAAISEIEPRRAELRQTLSALRAQLVGVASMDVNKLVETKARAEIAEAQLAEVDEEYRRRRTAWDTADKFLRRGWHDYSIAVAHWQNLADLDTHQARVQIRLWRHDLAATARTIREWDGGASLHGFKGE